MILFDETAPSTFSNTSLQNSRIKKNWKSIAAQVLSVGAILTYGVCSQVYAKELNSARVTNLLTGLSVGSLKPFLTILVPNKFDTLYANSLTKFDVPTFFTLSTLQQVFPQTVEMRQVFFPLIFMLCGCVTANEIAKKFTDSSREIPDEPYPLLEGDTRGSVKKFLIKGGFLVVAGGTSAGVGVATDNPYAWRFGLLACGMGPTIPLAQAVFSRLKQSADEVLALPVAARFMTGSITETTRQAQVLAALARFLPTLAKVGVCGAVSTLVLLHPSLYKIVPANGPLLIAYGIPLGLIDVIRQDDWHYKRSEQIDRKSKCCHRTWKDMSRRGGDYAGVVVTQGLLTSFFLANVIFPTPHSIMESGLFLAGSLGGFAGGRIVNELFPKGESAWKNQINFRTTRIAHLLATAFLPLLGSYYVGDISLEASYALWSIYGTFIGMFLNEMLAEEPGADPQVSTLFLMLSMVTIIGYEVGTL